MAEHVSTTCIICGEKSSLLSEYRDLSSLTKLLEAAQIRKFYQFLSGKMNCQSALSITIVHADQHLLTRKNYQSFLLQMVIRGLNKLSQGKANDIHRQGDLQFFPTTVYFVKRRSTNQNHQLERKPEAVWNFEQTTE